MGFFQPLFRGAVLKKYQGEVESPRPGKRLRLLLMMLIRFDDSVLDYIFLTSPQLLTQALLGVDFCRMSKVIINFPEKCFSMERDRKVSRYQSAYDNNVRSIGDLGLTDHSPKTHRVHADSS